VHVGPVQNTNMVDMAEQAEARYRKELNKVTYYVDEIKENLGTGVKEDLNRGSWNYYEKFPLGRSFITSPTNLSFMTRQNLER